MPVFNNDGTPKLDKYGNQVYKKEKTTDTIVTTVEEWEACAINGLVYTAVGDITIAGWHRIVGAVYAGNDIKCTGNWGEVSFAEQDPATKPSDKLRLLAWEF